MYSVNGKPFKSYLKAIAQADKTNSEVIETSTGIARWEPAPKASESKKLEYKGRRNAYNAYQKQKGN